MVKTFHCLRAGRVGLVRAVVVCVWFAGRYQRCSGQLFGMGSKLGVVNIQISAHLDNPG